MKIKFADKNLEKIEEAINNVAGKLESVVTIKDIQEAIKYADGKLSIIPKKYHKGASIVVNGFRGELPIRYQYKKEYVSVRLVRGVSDWFVVSVNRDYAYPKQMVKDVYIYINASQEEMIKEQLFKNYI